MPPEPRLAAFGQFPFGSRSFGGDPTPEDASATLGGVFATGTLGDISTTIEHHGITWLDGVSAAAQLGHLTVDIEGGAFPLAAGVSADATIGDLTAYAETHVGIDLSAVFAFCQIGILAADVPGNVRTEPLRAVQARGQVGAIRVEILNPDAFVHLQRVSAAGVAGEMRARSGWSEEFPEEPLWSDDSPYCNN